MEVFAKAALFIAEIGAYGIETLKYILYLRGVFKTYGTRERQREMSQAEILAAGGASARLRLDSTGKQVLREMLDFVKPWLRA
ncbi:MAG: hypothetical protein ABSH05_19000 [Bryobacteraceae bacterium]|jgi:hypothetical protein